MDTGFQGKGDLDWKMRLEVCAKIALKLHTRQKRTQQLAEIASKNGVLVPKAGLEPVFRGSKYLISR
jgi:hypothetical protein